MLEAQDITLEIDTKENEPLRLLNEISFKVHGGHFMAIVGPSGCGKTTLLKAIAGIQPETSGNFIWQGISFEDGEDFAPGEVGYVPQFSIAFDPLTVDESVEIAAKLKVDSPDNDSRNELIDKVLVETGLDKIADRPVKIISGGQKRRLSLAMELVSDPSLLLCDEVTSGLDPRSEREIVQLLHDISRHDNRIVISVTHSLDQLELYDSILVLHAGHIAYHGAPATMAHYFGVNTLEEVYPTLALREPSQWASSWEKRKEYYYSKLYKNTLYSDKQDTNSVLPDKEKDDSSSDTIVLTSNKNTLEEEKNAIFAPSALSQFFTLLGRRWQILMRDKTQLTLQLAMIILFPLLVALFSSKGQDPISKLTQSQDTNLLLEYEQRQMVNENQVRVGSAVSGIIMFEVILLGLMGSNNASREIAGERLIFEKEKYGGVSTSAYLASKITFLSGLVLIQSLWMFIFVEFFWPYRGDASTHLLFLILANAAMTSICLGISSLAKTPDQASLLSIYLVGFQLPLSGAVLALPTHIEAVVRPFISAYWAWSGSLSGLSQDVHNAVKTVIDTSLTPMNTCLIVLFLHIIVGLVLTSIGISRKQWD